MTNRRWNGSDEVIADLERSVPGIASISQVKQLFAIQQAQYLGKTAADILAFAISANYQQTTGRQVLQGRFFEPADFEDFHPVAIIDDVLVRQLFVNENPIGAGIFCEWDPVDGGRGDRKQTAGRRRGTERHPVGARNLWHDFAIQQVRFLCSQYSNCH